MVQLTPDQTLYVEKLSYIYDWTTGSFELSPTDRPRGIFAPHCGVATRPDGERIAVAAGGYLGERLVVEECGTYEQLMLL